MSQRIIAGREISGRTGRTGVTSGRRDDHLGEGLVQVKIDQVVLAREPNRILGQAVKEGLERSAVEVSIAYPPCCIGSSLEDIHPKAPHVVPSDAISLGFLTAQPGAGFAPAVHLERFGSPARLALTDDARLAGVGASGMLTITASAGQLTEALITGRTWVRRPVSIQIVLSGRLHPFISMRDASLELLRLGLETTVCRVDSLTQAPVVLEFGGSSAKLLSVSERAVLCAIAPRVGAAAALFSSDDKTETFLRDQKRSKAYRTLVADEGAPVQEVISLDLSSIQPLILDSHGTVRPVRELEGQRVSQVLLGGDTGLSLRDLLTAGSLLRSKRMPPGVEFLLVPPSHQCLEVLAQGETLLQLIAAGARIVDPDRRVLTGELYPPRPDGASLRNCDPENSQRAAPGLVASADTLSFAVAHGHVGDPRGFKRPVKISMPRQLPTEDVLIMRGAQVRGGAKGKGQVDRRHVTKKPKPDHFAPSNPPDGWHGSTELVISSGREIGKSPSILLAQCPQDIEWLIENAYAYPELRAVVASHIPSAMVTVLAGLGILALRANPSAFAELEGVQAVSVPSPRRWGSDYIELEAGKHPVRLDWLAIGAEQNWTWRGRF